MITAEEAMSSPEVRKHLFQGFRKKCATRETTPLDMIYHDGDGQDRKGRRSRQERSNQRLTSRETKSPRLPSYTLLAKQ